MVITVNISSLCESRGIRSARRVAGYKQRLGEFASREVPKHEIKVARNALFSIDWPPNGFVCMELIRAVAWAVSILLILDLHCTHHWDAAVRGDSVLRSSMLSSNLISRSDHDDTFLHMLNCISVVLCLVTFCWIRGHSRPCYGIEESRRRSSDLRPRPHTDRHYYSYLYILSETINLPFHIRNIIIRMTIQPLLQPFLIQVMSDEPNGTTGHKQGIQCTVWNDLICFVKRETTAVS